MASPAVNKSKTEELGGDSTPSRNKATAALSPKGSLVGTPGTPAAKGSGKKKKRGSGVCSTHTRIYRIGVWGIVVFSASGVVEMARKGVVGA